MVNSVKNPPMALQWSLTTVLAVAVCFGMVSGGAEVTTHLFRRVVLNRILNFGDNFVWMTPLADVVIFLLLGAFLLLLALAVPRLRRPGMVMAVFGAFGAFAPLLIAEQIHRAAALLLAVGLGVGLGRALASSADTVRRVALRLAPISVLLIVLLAGATHLARRAVERRAPANATSAPPGAPNILLLVLDTVRAWDVGWMGYWRPTTPRLVDWVARGAIFDRMMSTSPWTTPSHATMFTGQLPVDASAGWFTPLDKAHSTVAEVMRAAGYATAGFVGNYRYAGSATGLARGFERYLDYPVTITEAFRHAQLTGRILALPRVAAWLGSQRLMEAGNSAESVNRQFLEWVDTRGQRPFFAFINYFEGHAPYLPPAPWDSMFARAGDHDRTARHWDAIEQAFGVGLFPREFLEETHDAYDGSIAYLDFQIDSMLTVLAGRGLLENTVVIITSDHGEQFGEHGLIQHGSSLFLPVLHVPLAIVAPNRVPGGVHVPYPATLRSIASTILAFAGVPNPGLPGTPLTGYLRGPGLPVPLDTLFSAVDYDRLLPRWPPNEPVLRGNMRSVVLDSLHYILNGDGIEELFHLGRDSWETRNLAGLPEFRPGLEAHRAALKAIGRGK